MGMIWKILRRRGACVRLSGGILLCLFISNFDQSVAHPNRSLRQAAQSMPAERPPFSFPQHFEAALLQDIETGQVLFAHNGNRQWPAASLTKMMVALLAFEAVERGRLSLQTPVTISWRASQEGGRAINLRPGEVFSLRELLRAMLVTSANDAARAVAERLTGSVESCVKAMNARAQELGMRQTRYRTVNGLPPPDNRTPDVSSAVDMAILARALIKHAPVLDWTSRRRVPFRKGRTMLPNTNHLVGRVAGVDGLKTGFTSKARFNLVTTAQRDQLRLVAVVLGGWDSQVRFQTAATLLEWGFTNFTRMRLIKGGEPLWAEVQIEYGSISTLQPIAATDAAFLMRKSETADLRISLQLPTVIAAPIMRNQVLGKVVVRNSKRVLAVIPALSPWDVPRAQWIPARR